MMNLIRQLIQWQPLRYIISGGSGAVANLAVLFILVEFANVWYLAATIVAFLVAFTVSFTMQKFFTFSDYRKEKIANQGSVYLIIQIFNLAINTFLMYVAVDIAGIHYLLSQFIVAGGIAIYSFFLFKYLVFASPSEYKDTPCPVCGGKAGKKWGEKNGYTLLCCGECGLIFVSPMPQDTTGIYGQNYFEGGEEHGYTDYERDKEPMRDTFKQYLSHIERSLGKRGKILDIGCATGSFMEIAKAWGWDVEGIEISPYAAAKGRLKGMKIHTGIIEEVNLPEKSFDAITIFDAIEHIKDPHSVLLRARYLLKDGGVLAVTSPDAGSTWARILGSRWHLAVPPEHLILFNRRNFTLLLDRLGFTPVLARNIGKKFSLPYIFQTLFRWQNLSLWNNLAKVTNKGLLSKLKIPINLFDTFFMIAKKP